MPSKPTRKASMQYRKSIAKMTAKRRKKSKGRKMYKPLKKRKRRGDSENLNVRSVAQDFWISNPVTTDWIGTQFNPNVGQGDTKDGYVNLSNTLTGNGWVNTECNVLSTSTRDKYATLYKYYKVNYFWFKYTPAITQGTAFTLTSQGSTTASSAVNGQITFAVIRDVADRDIMTNSAEGNKKLRGRKNGKTVDMYKKCFIKYKPSSQIVYETGVFDKQRIEYNLSFPTTEAANYGKNTIACSMEVPKQCGIEQLTANPFDGTNYPAELNSVCIGSYTMGASITFFGKKGQE